MVQKKVEIADIIGTVSLEISDPSVFGIERSNPGQHDVTRYMSGTYTLRELEACLEDARRVQAALDTALNAAVTSSAKANFKFGERVMVSTNEFGVDTWHETKYTHHKPASPTNRELFYFQGRAGTYAVTADELSRRVMSELEFEAVTLHMALGSDPSVDGAFVRTGKFKDFRFVAQSALGVKSDLVNVYGRKGRCVGYLPLESVANFVRGQSADFTPEGGWRTKWSNDLIDLFGLRGNAADQAFLQARIIPVENRPEWFDERLRAVRARDSVRDTPSERGLDPKDTKQILQWLNMDGVVKLAGGGVIHNAILGADPETSEGVGVSYIDGEGVPLIVARADSIQGVALETAALEVLERYESVIKAQPVNGRKPKSLSMGM